MGVYEVNNLPHNTIDNLRWLIPMSIDTKLIFSSPIILKESREINMGTYIFDINGTISRNGLMD